MNKPDWIYRRHWTLTEWLVVIGFIGWGIYGIIDYCKDLIR